jgi:hypothetical protein
MTKLVMHYAPGVLAVLKRHDCPGQYTSFSPKRMHSTCGCDSDHQIFTIAGVTVLQNGEQSWCLERSWIHQLPKAASA